MAFEQRQIALWKVSTILGECQNSCSGVDE
jgi:hypothetical protein